MGCHNDIQIRCVFRTGYVFLSRISVGVEVLPSTKALKFVISKTHCIPIKVEGEGISVMRSVMKSIEI